MRILWITNVLFPEASAILLGNSPNSPFGGWMTSCADLLIQREGIRLAVATVSPFVKHLEHLRGAIIDYYILPKGKGNEKINHEYEKYWKQVSDVFHPDIIHIHGTEYSHGLAFVRACGSSRVIVSIQGLTSVCQKYYYADIPKMEFFFKTTIRDLVKGTVFQEKKRFQRRGKYEIELLKAVNHVIGRTTWDRAHSMCINPSATYHFCNETLRPMFYTSKWSYAECIPHSIFISQASYPIKGLHLVLKTLPFVLGYFPDTHLYVAGMDITRSDDPLGFLKRSSYGRIVRSLIRRLNLKNCVTFLGTLDEREMMEHYLSSNVFICPSSIENSPNSLCEAQILGVPSISSSVGGTPDLIPNSRAGYLYRYDDTEMLGYLICKVFQESSSMDTKEMRLLALKRHNSEVIINGLLSIYQSIVLADH